MFGASAACFVAYAEARRTASPGDKWGNEQVKGVAAAEAANNSVSSANIIPLLTLGIPGSVAAVLLGGVFLIHGMHIEPRIFMNHVFLSRKEILSMDCLPLDYFV